MKISTTATVVLLVLLGATAARGDLVNPSLNEYFHLGGYYLQVGQREKAIANYREMISRYPDSLEAQRAWLSIGDAYLELAQESRRQADPGLSRSKDFLAQAEKAYRTVLGRFPAAEAEARLRLGRLFYLYRDGEGETGRNWLRTVMQDFPERAGKAALLTAESWRADGKKDQAFRAFQAARLEYPEVAVPAVLAQIELLNAGGDYEQAALLAAEAVNSLSWDGYFSNGEYRGTTLKAALDGLRTAAQAEGDNGFAAEVISALGRRTAGTNAALTARFARAALERTRGQPDKAAEILEGIAVEWPRSLYAPQARLRQAAGMAAAEREGVLKKIRETWPRSIFWVTATEAWASACLEAGGDAEPELQAQGKKKAVFLLKEIINRYPASPEATRARRRVAALEK